MNTEPAVVTATHYVTKEPVQVVKGGPTNRRWTALYGTTKDGVNGTLHDENPMEYHTPRIWTFVPFGLPVSAYEIK